MRALLTGGAGFIGSHLAERLIDEGWEVVVVDSLVTGSLKNISHLIENPAFEFVEADVSKEIPVGGKFHAVLHLASPASPVDFEKIPVEIALTNSLGTKNALDVALENGAVFLLASTSEVYGDPDVVPQPETYWGNVNPIGVRSVYDEGKRFSEALVMAYKRKYGLPVRIVRIFNTYGPRMRPSDGRVIPNFISQALKGEPITVLGDGTQTRSFCYVSDLVDGIWRLLNTFYDEPINLGNPDEYQIKKVAEIVKNKVGSNSEIVYLDSRPDDPKRRRPDITRAKKVLGWKPKISFEEGLDNTIQYFRQILNL